MILFRCSYKDDLFIPKFLAALEEEFNAYEPDPSFVCIGSDRHLQDCLGPLTGTMLSSILPAVSIMGTLDQPIHAKNLIRKLPQIEKISEDRVIIAIDAAVGKWEDIGMIQLKSGSLFPGKALAKRLPPIGQYALTAVVDAKLNALKSIKENPHRLAPVYYMASLLSQSLSQWLLKRKTELENIPR